jgi:hypothetical protein
MATPDRTAKFVRFVKYVCRKGEQEIREIWRSTGTVATNSPDA